MPVMTNRPALQPRIRALALAAAIGIPATIAGCKDFLTAQNPAAIPAEACYLGWQESLTLLKQLVEAEIPDGM